MTDTQLRLMDFYQVDTLDKLIERQAEHILQLQNKLLKNMPYFKDIKYSPRQG